MMHLAFGRDNPRYVAAKESKKEETVPVLQCVQNLMNEFLPRMHKGNAAEFRSVLKGDAEAQSVIASYSEKIGAWIQKLAEKAEKSNSDVYTQFVAYLEEKGCLGTPLDRDHGGQRPAGHPQVVAYRAAGAPRLPGHAGPRGAGGGQAELRAPCIMEALARCGDKKYHRSWRCPSPRACAPWSRTCSARRPRWR